MPKNIKKIKKRVTLAQIASAVGVHVTTVSQVLTKRKNCWVSPETRKKIEEVAQKLEYRPNLVARGLRSGRSLVIGYISPGFGITSPHTRISGLTYAAAEKGYTVIVSSHPNDSESEDVLIKRLLDSGVDGIVVYPVDKGFHYELRKIVDSDFPVITFDGQVILDFETNDISPDYEEVGRLQVLHVFSLGKRKICIANTFPQAVINAVREKAIKKILRKEGLPPPLEMALPIDVTREFQNEEMLERHIRNFVVENAGKFDAVIGYDTLASLVVRVLLGEGLRVPEDVVVVGAGNTLLATHGIIPITSVSTSDDVAGMKAFDLLFQWINGEKPAKKKQIISKSILIPRKSSVG